MFCRNCGNKVEEGSKFCSNCGCSLEQSNETQFNRSIDDTNSTLKMLAKVFMIIGCISCSSVLIPLIWAIPMTISLCNKLKYNEKISVAFKVCTLLFVSLVAGILLLCIDDSDNNRTRI